MRRSLPLKATFRATDGSRMMPRCFPARSENLDPGGGRDIEPAHRVDRHAIRAAPRTDGALLQLDEPRDWRLFDTRPSAATSNA